jgi:hypothetical protein
VSFSLNELGLASPEAPPVVGFSCRAARVGPPRLRPTAEPPCAELLHLAPLPGSIFEARRRSSRSSLSCAVVLRAAAGPGSCFASAPEFLPCASPGGVRFSWRDLSPEPLVEDELVGRRCTVQSPSVFTGWVSFGSCGAFGRSEMAAIAQDTFCSLQSNSAAA